MRKNKNLDDLYEAMEQIQSDLLEINSAKASLMKLDYMDALHERLHDHVKVIAMIVDEMRDQEENRDCCNDEPLVKKFKVTFAYVVVREMKDGLLYYEIRYHKIGDKHDSMGFGSFDVSNCFEWMDKCFEFVEEQPVEVEIHADMKDLSYKLDRLIESCEEVISREQKMINGLNEQIVKSLGNVVEIYKAFANNSAD